MGQVKKTRQQIQNELDEIHKLLAQGATDQFIMNGRKDKEGNPIRIERSTFYRYKKKLYAQVGKMYEERKESDYFYDIQLCKERLIHDRVNATAMAMETRNPFWATLASELAVSILKLEAEGIKAIQSGQYRQLAKEVGYIKLNEPTPALPAITANAGGSLSEPTLEPDRTIPRKAILD